MSDHEIRLDIQVVDRFTEAMRSVGVSMEQAAEAMGRAFRTIIRALQPIRRAVLLDQRITHGGNYTDAIRWPHEWQSASCSAWLHEVCPSDQHQLECTCTCHRRKR